MEFTCNVVTRYMSCILDKFKKKTVSCFFIFRCLRSISIMHLMRIIFYSLRYKLQPACLFGAAPIVGYRGAVLNAFNLKTTCSKSTNSREAAGTQAFDMHVNFFDIELACLASYLSSNNLCCIRRAPFSTFKAIVTS